MYYGNLETEGIISTKNKAGTNYAYEYATASIVVRRLRFAVAVVPVRKRSILNMVRTVMGIVEELGIRIRILLDRCNKVPDSLRYSVHNACPETREGMRKPGDRQAI